MVEATAPAADPTTGEVLSTRFVPPPIKRTITVFHRKMTPGSLIYVKILSAIADAAPLKNAVPDPNAKKQQLMQVHNLETDQPEQITVGFVLKDILDESFPKNGYVGKYFRISLDANKQSKRNAQARYNTYSVAELDVPPTK